MKKPIQDYKKYLESVSSYNTAGEKNALIKILGDFDIFEICNILNITPKPSNELEGIAFLFQSRKKSVSESIDLTLKCKCGHSDFYVIGIDDLFFRGDEPELIEILPFGLINDLDDIKNLDSKSFDIISDMNLDEFNKLEESILKNNKYIFDPSFKIPCKKCKQDIYSIIEYKNIISKFPIKNIFEQYLDITQFTNMNKQDVDNMLPFEREIFINMIQERENKKE
jgi:hypothetical protein